MGSYIMRRLLALIPTLFFASLIVFVTVRLIPGDVIDLMLSARTTSAPTSSSRDQLIAALGLDQPMWEQYLRWIGGILLHGDFGRSLWQNTPVTRAAARAAAGHVRARPHGADRGADRRHPDRRLFGHPPGHGRRLPHPLVLDPDAGGAELLDGHHGDGVSVDLVGLVAGGEVRRLHATIRCRT